MREDQSRQCSFREELASIVAYQQSSVDMRAREAVFEALSGLEKRALIGGASDATLRAIAEARFLIGILREAVVPARSATLRTVLRARRPLAPRRLAEAGLDQV